MQTLKPVGRGRIYFLFAVLGMIALAGITMRLHAANALRSETRANAIPTVSTVKPAQGPRTEEIVLPGNIQAWHEATIYARTNGYVKEWYTPMGTQVHTGEILAELETPEVDAQLRQAEADLKTAQANNDLAQATAKRWKALLKSDSVSRQDAEEKIADAAAKEATLASARANRDHLAELESFKIVRAPFDGVISSRTLDIGMLVNEGSQTQQPLFHIVQANPLRLYVKVPQNYATIIGPDIKAEVHLAEHPGKIYTGTFLKTADAIDPASRTLLVEFRIDNTNGELLSGGYAETHIKLPASDTAMRLPVNTLIFRADGLQIATVDANSRAVLKSVTMGRDFGNEVEIKVGIGPQDSVIINPPDSLFSGQQVRLAKPVTVKEEKDKDGKKQPE